MPPQVRLSESHGYRLCRGHHLLIHNNREGGLPARAIVVIADFDGAKVKANYIGELNALRIGARVRVVRKDGNIYFTNY